MKRRAIYLLFCVVCLILLSCSGAALIITLGQLLRNDSEISLKRLDAHLRSSQRVVFQVEGGRNFRITHSIFPLPPQLPREPHSTISERRGEIAWETTFPVDASYPRTSKYRIVVQTTERGFVLMDGISGENLYAYEPRDDSRLKVIRWGSDQVASKGVSLELVAFRRLKSGLNEELEEGAIEVLHVSLTERQ